MAAVRYDSFSQFYPYYLAQHDHRMCRRAHFLGTSSAIAAIAQFVASPNPLWLLVAVTAALLLVMVPTATFAYPWYSFRADWVMYWEMLTGKLSW